MPAKYVGGVTLGCRVFGKELYDHQNENGKNKIEKLVGSIITLNPATKQVHHKNITKLYPGEAVMSQRSLAILSITSDLVKEKSDKTLTDDIWHLAAKKYFDDRQIQTDFVRRMEKCSIPAGATFYEDLLNQY